MSISAALVKIAYISIFIPLPRQLYYVYKVRINGIEGNDQHSFQWWERLENTAFEITSIKVEEVEWCFESEIRRTGEREHWNKRESLQKWIITRIILIRGERGNPPQEYSESDG